MQFVRFLTDYLNGDTYYKTTYKLHNLNRSKVQLQFLKIVEKKYKIIAGFINMNK